MSTDAAKKEKDVKPLEAAFYQYHHATKHTLEKLLQSGYRLDWANQPDPFRIYKGAVEVALSHRILTTPCKYFELTRQRHPEAAGASADLLSSILFYSMAISAWKQVRGTNNKWALRCNASSGNLHPTDTHVLVHQVEGIRAGSYHYRVDNHSLELRAEADLAPSLWKRLTGSDDCPQFLIVFTSILWREVWKYRQRGFRYCQHDMGHALGSLDVAARSFGWNTHAISLFCDSEIASYLGLAGGDEKPALIVGLSDIEFDTSALRKPKKKKLEKIDHKGKPNVLSKEMIAYEIVDKMYEASCYSEDEWISRLGKHELAPYASHLDRLLMMVEGNKPLAFDFDNFAGNPPIVAEIAHKTIRRRRSAVDMDGKRRMPAQDLALILDGATKGFSADFQSADHHLVHLYLYLHRIDGLEEGLYYFDRNGKQLLALNQSDQKDVAKGTSCIQDIAADGCFSISMIADFNRAYAMYGDRGYRIVHYEAGFIGQLLYLSSTALGYDATGIGCFIDDAINQYLCLPEGEEVIYNFTIGEAVLDPRLTTLPSYDWISANR